MRKLVVTEKNNAAIRIATILSGGKVERSKHGRVQIFSFARDGNDYTVIGLRGHILNLDYPDEYNNWDTTTLQKLVRIEPTKRETAPDIVRALESVARTADEVIISTDFDREGELIGVEAMEIVRRVNRGARIRRARFSALTKVEIEDAFGNLTEVDLPLARSAESRQIVDLAWGATLTRFISLAANRRGRDFLSVGRVQSPTLALVVDREKHIRDFVPRDFWRVVATFDRDGTTFPAEHAAGRFWERAKAEAAAKRAKAAEHGNVLEYLRQEREERPPVPFNTTAFLAEANRLGLSAARAMSVAESLYQSGYISYPRTDNQVYPSSLNVRTVLEKLRESAFAKEAEEVLAQPTIRPRRGRTQTTDHPPIYPVGAAAKSHLKGDRWTVYELVVRRFLATLAPNCVVDASEAKLDAGGEVFEANGHVVVDPGWRKYYPYWRVRHDVLPVLTVGEAVPLASVDVPHDTTRPPPRFSQGSLLQEMDRLGLGTKSTRHEIIQKLYDRKFVEGRDLRPTVSGQALAGALKDHVERITQPEMTAHLEADMQEIARGVRTQDEVVRESQSMLEEILETLERNEQAIGQEITAALQEQNYIGRCNVCGEGTLMVMRSRRGRRFLGCDRYPDCRNAQSLPQVGTIVSGEQNCPECDAPMIKRVDHRREEVLCVNEACPTVRARNVLGPCGKCGTGELTIRQGRAGKRFFGCTNYPTCDNSGPLPQRGHLEPARESCPECGMPIMRVIIRGRPPWVTCVNFDCPAKKNNKRGKRKSKGKARKRRPRKKPEPATPEVEAQPPTAPP